MGWDPSVWEDPMEFKPERFLNDETFDITGSKEIKMMPFGAGRIICPGYNLALLHLEYFVANLVWNFNWNHFKSISWLSLHLCLCIGHLFPSTILMSNFSIRKILFQYRL